MTAHAILFDMDGLLLDTEKVCFDNFVETRRHFSLSDSPDVFLRCVGVRRPECDRIPRLQRRMARKNFCDASA